MSISDRAKLELHDRIAAIYADDRFLTDHPGTREAQGLRAVAVAMVWVIGTRAAEPGEFWDAVQAHVGLGGGGDNTITGPDGVTVSFSRDRFALQRVISEDAPRYQPADWLRWRRCEVILPRAKRPCGKSSSRGFRVTDWATGQWRLAEFCHRHRAEGEAAWRAERDRQAAGNIPEPTPNMGGLLALHVPWKRWPDVYAWARPVWTPPALGINRDDWPVLEKVAGLEPPKLVVIRGDGEDGSGSGRPPLEFIPGGAS